MTVGAKFLYESECLWVSQSKRFDVSRRKMDVSLLSTHAVGEKLRRVSRIDFSSPADGSSDASTWSMSRATLFDDAES